MPAVVIPAILAAGGAALGGASIGAIAAAFAINLALGALQYALGGKPKTPELPSFQPFSARAQSRTQQIQQPISARRLLVGESRISGPMLFVESTGDNKYLHLVIALGEGEFTEIGEVWLNDDPIFEDDVDGSGNVTAGKFSGLVRIKRHLGGDDQAADSDLVSETSVDSNFRLRGIAYLYVRLQFDQDTFPTRIPNISAWCKGPAVLDTRDDTARWTPNAALQLRAYMVDGESGLGCEAGEIDDDVTDASANTCDEMVAVAAGVSHTVASVETGTDDELLVLDGDLLELQTGDRVDVTSTDTVPGGTGAGMFVIPVRRKATDDKGIAIRLAATLADAYAGIPADITSEGAGTITTTKTHEPRYVACGLIETDRRPFDIMSDLLTAMGGSAVHAGGKWRVSPQHYAAPTVTLDENHLRSNLGIATKFSRRERFTRVKGVYVSPLNQGQPSDYPAWTEAAFDTEDGREIWAELDLPFTPRPHAAQRLAKRHLRRHRKQLTVTADWSLHALQVQCGDTVALDNTRMGWSAKPCEVARWQLKVRDGGDGGDQAPELVVAMTLREIDATVDAWTLADETAVSPVPATTLPSVFSVAAPTTLAVSTDNEVTATLDEVSFILFSWATPNDFYVRHGGRFEVQYKRSADSTWSETWDIGGDRTSVRIGPLSLGVKYDVRVRALNHLKVRSAWSQLSGFTLGAPSSGATATEDWGLFSQPAPLAVDWGGYGDAASLTEDWETFV